MHPIVSVIMPVFNSQLYIRESIQSIINQDYENWELIIVDDGSTDSSLSIALTYAYMDSRIKVFTINNSGAAVARNFAINKSKAEWICFVDSDDYIEKNYLKSLLNSIELDIDIVLSNLMMENDGKYYSFNDAVGLKCGDVYFGENSLRRTFPWQIHLSGIIKKKHYNLNSGFEKINGLSYNSDEYITRRLLYEGKILINGKSRYYYRSNMSSTTKKKGNFKSLQQLDVNELIFIYLLEKNLIDLAVLVKSNQNNVFNKVKSNLNYYDLNEEERKIYDSYRSKYEV
jgi:glycosyltransferase involved in cell wall biosynthesis